MTSAVHHIAASTPSIPLNSRCWQNLIAQPRKSLCRSAGSFRSRFCPQESTPRRAPRHTSALALTILASDHEPIDDIDHENLSTLPADPYRPESLPIPSQVLCIRGEIDRQILRLCRRIIQYRIQQVGQSGRAFLEPLLYRQFDPRAVPDLQLRYLCKYFMHAHRASKLLQDTVWRHRRVIPQYPWKRETCPRSYNPERPRNPASFHPTPLPLRAHPATSPFHNS
jgi:hypothetical protein